MAIIDKIKAKAKADVKHIVLPEGDEPRTVKAASIIAEQGLAKLTLLGNPEKIKEVAAANPQAKYFDFSDAIVQGTCENVKKHMHIFGLEHKA